jgi:hypothetical protein
LEQLEPAGFRGEGNPGWPALNEAAARELAPLLRNGGDAVREAYEETVEQHGPEPTAKQVREVVRKRIARDRRNGSPPGPGAPSWVLRMEFLIGELRVLIREQPTPDRVRCRTLRNLLADVDCDLDRLASGADKDG